MVDLALLLLSAIVPGQLQQALPLHDRSLCVVLQVRVRSGVSQEVQVKRSILVLDRAQQGHSHHLLVKLEARLRGLDPKHTVVEAVVVGVGGGADVFAMTTDQLYPVSVWIFGKRNVLHAAVGELLLEGVPSILDSLAGHCDVVDGDGDVTKAAVGFGVAIHDAVVGVILSAVVVGEFENSVAVGPMAVTLERTRAVVGEEVEGELVLGEVEVLDLVET